MTPDEEIEMEVTQERAETSDKTCRDPECKFAYPHIAHEASPAHGSYIMPVMEFTSETESDGQPWTEPFAGVEQPEVREWLVTRLPGAQSKVVEAVSAEHAAEIGFKVLRPEPGDLLAVRLVTPIMGTFRVSLVGT